MYEVLISILGHLQGMWRYRWQALLVAWTLYLGGTGIVYMMTDRYAVQARVFVDTETVLRPLLQGLAVDTPVTSQVNMMSQALLSREQLEQVALETDLHLRASTPAQMEQLIEQLSLNIRLSGGGRDNAYEISYEDSDPEIAYGVVSTLLDSFVENTLGENRADSDSAQRFLLRNIAELEQRLREAEAQLADFKKEHVGLMPGDGGDYYTRLQAAMDELDDQEIELGILEGKRDLLLLQIEGEQPTFGILSSGDDSGAGDARITRLEEQIEELLTRYTERHPEVIALREQISILEAQLFDQRMQQPTFSSSNIASDPTTLALSSLDLNPVYQRMKIELNETEVLINETERRILEQTRNIEELQSLVDTIPEVEAELADLNRDYEVAQNNHTALLQRLESARLSEQADLDTEEVQFRILEQPILPLVPIAPNRPALLAGVLMFALIAGSVLAFFLHQINPVFSTRRMVVERLGIPVLGVVSLARDSQAEAAARKQVMVYGVSGAALLVAFLGSIVFLGIGVPLVHMLFGVPT